MNRQAYHQKYFAANRKKYREAQDRTRARLKDLIREAKSKPCMDCGESYHWYVMDLDHRDPSMKEIQPALIVNRGWSVERAQKELDKCDAVCSNCHRIRTYKQLNIAG